VQVRRPPGLTGPAAAAFISGKKKQNTKKTTVITGPGGHTLWAGGIPARAACMTRRR